MQRQVCEGGEFFLFPTNVTFSFWFVNLSAQNFVSCVIVQTKRDGPEDLKYLCYRTPPGPSGDHFGRNGDSMIMAMHQCK